MGGFRWTNRRPVPRSAVHLTLPDRLGFFFWVDVGWVSWVVMSWCWWVMAMGVGWFWWFGWFWILAMVVGGSGLAGWFWVFVMVVGGGCRGGLLWAVVVVVGCVVYITVWSFFNDILMWCIYYFNVWDWIRTRLGIRTRKGKKPWSIIYFLCKNHNWNTTPTKLSKGLCW